MLVAPGTRGLRWSSTADCPRKAALASVVEPDRGWTDREARVLYRGRAIGGDYAAWLKAKYGGNAVWKEVRVEWAFGIGHIDIFLRPTRTAIEVLSSAWADDTMIQRKLLQLVGYMEAYPRAANGCLVVLNPSDFSEDRWPLAKDTDTYRGLVDLMHARVAALALWKETGELPERVCRRPNDAIGHFCRHAATCFEGWEPPDPDSVVRDPHAIQLAAALAAAKQEEKAAKAVATAAEDARKEVEAKLADLAGVADVRGDIRIGSFMVKRTFVQRKPSLDVTKAETAGALNLELLAEFMRPGASYWTTTIERKDDGAVLAEFGDEAPWTDEDLAA